MAVPRPAWSLLALALIAPFATAAGAQGVLQVSGEASTIGASTLDASRVDLLWNATHVPALRLSGASFTVDRFGESWSQQETPLGAIVVQPPTKVEESRSMGPGTLILEQGSAAQFLALRSAGPAVLQLDNATIRPTSAVLFARVFVSAANENNDGGKCEGPTCLDDHGVYEFATGVSKGALTGDVALFLRGPTAIIDAEGNQQRFSSGVSTTGSAPTQQTEETWVIIHVKSAHGTVVAGGPAKWYAPASTLQTSVAQASEATGDVTVGLSAYRATAEALDLRGAIALVLDPVAEGTWGSLTPTTYAPGFTLRVQGDVTAINLHAKPVYEQAPATGAGIAALVALGAALAYYWPLVSFHATSAVLPLYSRLKRPEILANHVRNSIYEIIRGHPGISAREVHRQSEQSWGTVVYHLRQLERHDLVVSRSVGRTRNYYENHGKYRGMEVQLACLQSARARALARFVLEAPGITQEDLVTRSRFPQPTTSYYVRKLRSSALVEERREGRYARYHPMPDLARFLQLAESDPAAVVDVAAAVSIEG